MSELETQDQLTNPYYLIRKLKSIIDEQKNTIEEYQLACDIVEDQRKRMSQQLGQKKRFIEQLNSRQRNEYNLRIQAQAEAQELKMRLKAIQQKGKFLKIHRISPQRHMQKSQKYYQKDIYKSIAPEHKITESNVFQSQRKLKDNHSQQFVPQNVKFHRKTQNLPTTESIFNKTFFDNGPLAPAESLIQDFFVIGPDDAQFRKIRDNDRTKNFAQVNPDDRYNINKVYKKNNANHVQEIVRRAFPNGITMKKKIVETKQQIRQIIQFKPQRKLGRDYFVFTLVGDNQILQRNRGILQNVNPSNFLYIFCLKLPDFICLRDEKYYQRKNNQIWIIEKVYAFATYYPFTNIFIAALQKIQSILYNNRITKIMDENQNFLIWQFSRNLFDLQKNQQIKQILTYLVNRKPDYGQVCYTAGHYLGVMPEYGYASHYALARTTAPIFFSTFSYEEALLLLHSIFCEKTLVFISTDESVATLCALFLVSLIWPFKLQNSQLLLNCNSEKIPRYIFECPFAMITSIKKTHQNLHDILGLFAQSNILRFQGHQYSAQYILVDVDTNTILYDPPLHKMYEQLIFSPSDKLQNAYLKINSCSSKSFSFPKKMPRVITMSRQKHTSGMEKNEEEKKKKVQEYIQKLQNNKCKTPNYNSDDNEIHETVLKYFIQFIMSLTIDKNDVNDFRDKPKEIRTEFIKNYLLQKHKNNKDRIKFINNLVKSQFYANYMDSLYCQ